MKEITIFGRGGQGAVTGAQLLATAAFLDGYWAQTFPKFGAERRGAPVMAYVRLDKKPIPFRSKVYNPDVVIVMDSNLFKMVNPLDGIRSDGTAIINFKEQDSEFPSSLRDKVAHLFTIDASSIAYEIYGKTAIPITNVIIVGAYCAAQNDISLESVYRALPDYFSKDKLEINRKAVQMGFENVRGVL